MEAYKDQNRSFKERAADLVSKMTLEEKITQVGNVASAIPRLDVPAYDYWSEASHGETDGRNGISGVPGNEPVVGQREDQICDKGDLR